MSDNEFRNQLTGRAEETQRYAEILEKGISEGK
jgi:hypothetical protein